MAKEKEDTSPSLKVLWDWLNEEYQFKRDVVKGRILLKPRDSQKDYKILEDEELNSIVVDAVFDGVKGATLPNVQMLLNSDRIEGFHPIQDYLVRVSKKRPNNTIKKFCDCVSTNNDKLFYKYFEKWLVASVANAMIKTGCQNHTCITLTGGQGKGKTTLLTAICPKDLQDYIYTGELDLTKKADTVWKLAQYWFINIEEQIKALNKADANYVKQLITLPDIKGRKPYGRLEATGYRLANFMASTNDDDFLSDPSGSRRFLCFNVKDIDLQGYKKVNIDDLWAEAFWKFKDQTFVYWIDPNDLIELQENNKEYVSVSQEYEYLNLYVTVPTAEKKTTHIVTSSTLRDFLKAETNNNNLNERRVGIALTRLGFERVSHRFDGMKDSMKAWAIHLHNAGSGNLMLAPFAVNGNVPEKQEPKPQPPKPTQQRLALKDDKTNTYASAVTTNG